MHGNIFSSWSERGTDFYRLELLSSPPAFKGSGERVLFNSRGLNDLTQARVLSTSSKTAVHSELLAGMFAWLLESIFQVMFWKIFTYQWMSETTNHAMWQSEAGPDPMSRVGEGSRACPETLSN